jgi:hypothetical protein
MRGRRRFRLLWPVGPLPLGPSLPSGEIWRSCNGRLRWGCCIGPFADVAGRWLSGNHQKILFGLGLPLLILIIILRLRARHARRSLPSSPIICSAAWIILSERGRAAIACGRPSPYRGLFPDRCHSFSRVGCIWGFLLILSAPAGECHLLPIEYGRRF